MKTLIGIALVAAGIGVLIKGQLIGGIILILIGGGLLENS